MRDKLIETTEKIMSFMQTKFRERLAAQGHNLTGKLSDSIRYEVSESGREVSATMYMAEYGTYVEFGVSAEKVPFGGGGGGGGTSGYIQGLIRFWGLRGLSGREAVGAAFATAKVHKREGMPSRASARFSSDGKRIGFVRDTVADHVFDIKSILAREFAQEARVTLFETIDGFEFISRAA